MGSTSGGERRCRAEQRAESRDQRAGSREQSREQRAQNTEQRAESREHRVESKSMQNWGGAGQAPTILHGKSLQNGGVNVRPPIPHGFGRFPAVLVGFWQIHAEWGGRCQTPPFRTDPVKIMDFCTVSVDFPQNGGVQVRPPHSARILQFSTQIRIQLYQFRTVSVDFPRFW